MSALDLMETSTRPCDDEVIMRDQDQDNEDKKEEQESDADEDKQASDDEWVDFMEFTEDEAKDRLSHFLHDVCRPRSSQKLAEMFLRHGPTIEMAEALSYDQLVLKLRKTRLMAVSNDMVVRLTSLINWNRVDDPRVSGRVHVKIFQAAYIIAAKPESVFEVVDDLSNTLSQAARPMLLSFHDVCRRLSEGELWKDMQEGELVKEFPVRFCTYLRSFKAWKVVDERRIAAKITHALRMLTRAERQVQSDMTRADLLKDIDDQKQRLLTKLRLIAGDEVCDEWLKEAAEEERKRAAGEVCGKRRFSFTVTNGKRRFSFAVTNCEVAS
jgi:hypothetical protein